MSQRRVNAVTQAAVTYWLKQPETCGLRYYETSAAHCVSPLRVQQHLAFNVTDVEFLFRSHPGHLVPLGFHFSNAPTTHLAAHITTWWIWTGYPCFASLYVQENLLANPTLSPEAALNLIASLSLCFIYALMQVTDPPENFPNMSSYTD